MAPILLKAKGGKAFGPLANLSDADSLHSTWKASSRVSSFLEYGDRLENLSWRLWHIRQLIVDDEAESSRSGAARYGSRALSQPMSADSTTTRMQIDPPEPAAHAFNSLSATVANKLESGKRHPVNQLSAPQFRWTDANDLIRHRGIMRHRRRDERGASQSHTSSHSRHPSLTSAQPVQPTNNTEQSLRKRRRSNASDTSSSSSSSSTSDPQESSVTRTSAERANGRAKTPPVCWRLTKAKAARTEEGLARGVDIVSQRHGGSRVETQSTWTIQQIEDAEQELREQGIELTGPFSAMLSELKAGDLTRNKAKPDPENISPAKSKEIEAPARHADTAAPEPQHHAVREDAEVPQVSAENVRNEQQTKVDMDTNREPPSADQHLSAMQSHSDVKAAATVCSSTMAATSSLQEVAPAGSSAILKDEPGTEPKPRSKPQCTNCGATSTPLWRRDANFELQCNACGLYEKLHKAPRPKTLKQRRSDRRAVKDSPNGEPSQSRRSSLSPSNTTSAGRDEWLGIHAGSICANCGTSTTPLWRKDNEGRIICNACGLYYKLHNAHRPVTMRMDAIKRRARYDDRRRQGTGSDASNYGGAGQSSGGFAASAFGDEDDEDIEADGTHPSYSTIPPMSHGEAAMFGSMQPQGVNAPPFIGHQQPNGPAAPFHVHGQPQFTPHHPHFAQGMHPVQPTFARPDDGIHIPPTMWEHGICPMGAWGSECCQNLPQPPPDIQSALMASAAATAAASMPPSDSSPSAMMAEAAQNGATQISTTPHEEISVSAAMDAILGNHDWMLDFGCGTGLPAESVLPSMSSTDADAQKPQHFDPAALRGTTNADIVGPTFPLKRRRGTSSARHGADSSSPEARRMVDSLHQQQQPSSGGASHSAQPMSDSASLLGAATPGASASLHSDAQSAAQMGPPSHWWPFTTPPGTVQ